MDNFCYNLQKRGDAMRGKLIILLTFGLFFILTISFLIISNVNAMDNEWVCISEEKEKCFSYYDKRSIREIEGRIYEVLTKFVLPEEDYMLIVYRVNCSLTEIATRIIKYYGKEGNLERRVETDEKKLDWLEATDKWTNIMEIICKQE